MNLSKLTELYIYDGSYNDHHTPNYIEGLGYAIPHVKDPKTVTFIENLNVQTSRYHKETVMDHIALVVYNMHRDYGNTFGELAIAIAILHDLGKKYTIGINNIGDICYYGHEKLSAEIARNVITNTDIYRNNLFTDEDVDTLYNVIYHHLDLKLIKDEDMKEIYCQGFRQKYGKRALDYLVILDKEDQGIADTNDLYSKETLDKIQIGTNIIMKYVEKW